MSGATLHFIHERGRGPTPLPLALVHVRANFFDVRRWIEMSADGHFAAIEAPKRLARTCETSSAH